MGLAGARTKQRFGWDPRNTNWANNTNRFGHRHLERMGWAPGQGLGADNTGMQSHVKVQIKMDNAGLGANLHRKRAKKDEFDSGENVHLDAFQRLLGRLNGKEEEIADEVERKRTQRIVEGRWGVHFVKGATLRSTWDTENRTLKRKRDEQEEDEHEKKSKKGKKDKKEKSKEKKQKEKSGKSEKKEKKEKKDKKEKKEKKDKKDKKDKKEKKHKSDKSSKSGAKKSKSKDRSESPSVTRESMLAAKEGESSATVIGSRMALRSKWIRQKRAAVMDPKALAEIFMIK